MASIGVFHVTGGQARRRGVSDGQTTAPPSTRDSLVYGTYIPGDSTTGLLPGSVLTDFNDPATNNVTWSTGGSWNNLTIYGDVKFTNTTDAVFNNCKFVGGNHVPSGASGVIDCNTARSGTGRAKFYDCEIIPRRPSINRDCIVGHRYSMYRCKLQQGIDGAGIFKNVANAPADVEIQGTWISNLTYFFPDYQNGVSGATWHTDGSHNDCIQIQGGTNIHIQGNFLEGTSSLGAGSGDNPDKPWLLEAPALTDRINNGSGIIVQNNVSSPTDNTVIIEDNYFIGNLAQLNVKPNMTFIFRNNHHYRKTGVHTVTPKWSGYWIRFDDHTPVVTGLTTGTNNNRWMDGPYSGAVLVEPRDTGIQYDA